MRKKKKKKRNTVYAFCFALPPLCLANRSHLIYVFPGRETRNSRILILVSVSRNKGSPMNLPPSLSAKFKIDPAGGVYFSPPSERPSRKLRPCRGFLPSETIRLKFFPLRLSPSFPSFLLSSQKGEELFEGCSNRLLDLLMRVKTRERGKSITGKSCCNG